MARTFTPTTGASLQIADVPITAYPFSMACWFNATSIASGNPFQFGKSASNVDNGGISVSSNKLATFVNGTSTNFQINSAANISTATWYPVVFVCASINNHTQYYYSAGSLISATDATSVAYGGTNTTVMAGVYGGTNQAGTDTADFTGSVAQCAIWNVALTVAEATAYCQGALPGNIRPTALKGWWPLDGLALPEPDLSGFAKNLAKAGVLTTPALAPGPPIMPFTRRWPQPDVFIPPPPIAVTGYRQMIIRPQWDPTMWGWNP